MIIGVISDTHDRLPALEQALELLQERGAKVLVHCGDWTKPETLAHLADLSSSKGLPLYGVFGNRDDYQALRTMNSILAQPVIVPPDFELLQLTLDERRVAVYHGHHKPTLRRLLEDSGYDAVFTGHTHKPLIASSGERIAVNPGSTAFSIPRKKEPRSVAVYDTATNEAELIRFEPED